MNAILVRLRITVVMLALAAAIAIAAASGAGCAAKTAALPYGLKSAEQLSAVEVREYQGKRLDSVVDFRENSIKGPQYVDTKTYRLDVDGLVVRPKSYKYDEVIDSFKHYRKVVTLNCVEGWSATTLWEGVMVSDILEASHPEAAATTVIFHARDGYTTSFPLEYFQKNDRIMAYKMNGVRLPPERGFPFELVAEDKWGYKWVRWIERIELSADKFYKGYWEQRGYSNDGSLKNEPFTR